MPCGRRGEFAGAFHASPAFWADRARTCRAAGRPESRAALTGENDASHLGGVDARRFDFQFRIARVKCNCRRADLEDIAVSQQARFGKLVPGDEHTIPTIIIADRSLSSSRRLDPGVLSRNNRMADDNLALVITTDPHPAIHRGRPTFASMFDYQH